MERQIDREKEKSKQVYILKKIEKNDKTQKGKKGGERVSFFQLLLLAPFPRICKQQPHVRLFLFPTVSNQLHSHAREVLALLHCQWQKGA